MPHISGGFRGTRAGATAGMPSPGQTRKSGRGACAPRPDFLLVQQRPRDGAVFAQLPQVQIPESGTAAAAALPAARDSRTVRRWTHTPGEPSRATLEYVKERRTSAEADSCSTTRWPNYGTATRWQ